MFSPGSMVLLRGSTRPDNLPAPLQTRNILFLMMFFD
jgi:hypothetical protein